MAAQLAPSRWAGGRQAARPGPNKSGENLLSILAWRSLALLPQSKGGSLLCCFVAHSTNGMPTHPSTNTLAATSLRPISSSIAAWPSAALPTAPARGGDKWQMRSRVRQPPLAGVGQTGSCTRDGSAFRRHNRPPAKPGSGTKWPTRASTMSRSVTPSRPASSVRSQLPGAEGLPAAAAATAATGRRRCSRSTASPSAAAGVAPIPERPRCCDHLGQQAAYCSRTAAGPAGADTRRLLIARMDSWHGPKQSHAAIYAIEPCGGQQEGSLCRCQPGQRRTLYEIHWCAAVCLTHIAPVHLYSSDAPNGTHAAGCKHNLFRADLLDHVSCATCNRGSFNAGIALAPCMQGSLPLRRCVPPLPPGPARPWSLSFLTSPFASYNVIMNLGL